MGGGEGEVGVGEGRGGMFGGRPLLFFVQSNRWGKTWLDIFYHAFRNNLLQKLKSFSCCIKFLLHWGKLNI